jgi:hypothetical protein
MQLGADDIKLPDSDLVPLDFIPAQDRHEAKTGLLTKLKDVDALTPRDLAIRKNLIAFTESHQRNGKELSLAYMGLFHAIDFFIVSPETDATYVNKPFTSNTLAIPDGTRALQAALKMPSPPQAVGEIAGSYYVMPYVSTAETLKNLHRKKLPEKTFSAHKTDQTLLVISELHGLVSTKWVEELPTSECLHSLGISKIRLGMEGFAKGSNFKLQDILNRRNYLEQFKYRAQKLGLTLDQLLAATKMPAPLQDEIKTGKIEDNPAIPALVRKLISYELSGVDIQLEGLESPDYNALEGN